MNALVVFYSRSGNTRTLAERIADALHADLDEIVDHVDRRGILGYLRSGTEASFHMRPKIDLADKDPRAYDLVIVGTPVWRVSMSSPVRAYLASHARELRRVAFFCTMGGFGGAHVFRQMEQLSGRHPLATLARTEEQLASKDLSRAVDAFASRLRNVRVPEPAPARGRFEGHAPA